MIVEWVRGAVGVAGTLILMGTSGRVNRAVLRRAARIGPEEELDISVRDTGVVVGKCENILIVVLMILEAYTALSIIFATKMWIGGGDDPRVMYYYRAGTMVNVTYSVLFALALKKVLSIL